MKQPSKKTSKKIKLTDPKINQEPPAGAIALNFEASTGSDIEEAMEEAKTKSWAAPQPTVEDIQESINEASAKITKAAPESAPDGTELFSLDVFLRENLEAKGEAKKVTTLDIVDKYQAAAQAAGQAAQPKFTVQRSLRELMYKNFPSAVYSNSTPNGFKGVVWKAVSEGTKAQLKSH
jgi:hypothetical protein